MNRNLFPHFENGQPNLAASGDFALAYQHPDDPHMTLIFNEVSEAFVEAYIESREWTRDAVSRGWEFRCLPAVEIRGIIQ